MSLINDIRHAKWLLNKVLLEVYVESGELFTGWDEPREDGGRFYGPLRAAKAYCLVGGATVENRALWYYGNTAMYLNVAFMVALDKAEEEAMMPAWIDCQNKYFPGIKHYMYGYPDGVAHPYGQYPESSYPLYMPWYVNEYPTDAVALFEENIAVKWGKDDIQRYADDDIRALDLEYESMGQPASFLEEHPFYISADGHTYQPD